jgi:hypothetical protein
MQADEQVLRAPHVGSADMRPRTLQTDNKLRELPLTRLLCTHSLLQADKYGVPRMCFINKMDRMGANFYKAVDSIVNLLGAKPCILQVLLNTCMLREPHSTQATFYAYMNPAPGFVCA